MLAPMEPSSRASFDPAGAGALLGGVTLAGIGAGALIGWAAGSVGLGILGAPRPVPRRWVPALGGALTVAIALPLFVVADWPLAGWAIAAVLWVGVQAFGLLLARLKPGPDNLAGSGAFAFGMMLRLLAILVVLLAVVSSNRDVGLAAALTYGIAYTAELGLNLLGYYGQEPSL